MNYLTDDKLVIFGSAGAIGSNMVQAALTLGLTPNIAMVDPYDKGNEGAAEEIYHCAFPGARVTWTSDPAEGLSGAKYIISSGGAPRKGVLGIVTTRGDRLFISLLGSAFIHLAWLGLTNMPLRWASIVSLVWIAVLIRRG